MNLPNQLFPDLQQKNQSKCKNWKSPVVVISREIFESDAWLNLTPSVAPQLYILFLGMRTTDKRKRKKGEKPNFVNEHELKFPFRLAAKFGITGPRFQRGIQALVKNGFIDILKPGVGMHRECTEFGLSDRWRDYDKAKGKRAGRARTKRGF